MVFKVENLWSREGGGCLTLAEQMLYHWATSCPSCLWAPEGNRVGILHSSGQTSIFNLYRYSELVIFPCWENWIEPAVCFTCSTRKHRAGKTRAETLWRSWMWRATVTRRYAHQEAPRHSKVWVIRAHFPEIEKKGTMGRGDLPTLSKISELEQ